jgi:hypothetical protein
VDEKAKERKNEKREEGWRCGLARVVEGCGYM